MRGFESLILCQKESRTFGCGFSFLPFGLGFEPIQCRCPVDICLPPVSTAATPLFSSPKRGRKCKSNPSSRPSDHPNGWFLFFLHPEKLTPRSMINSVPHDQVGYFCGGFRSQIPHPLNAEFVQSAHISNAVTPSCPQTVYCPCGQPQVVDGKCLDFHRYVGILGKNVVVHQCFLIPCQISFW